MSRSAANDLMRRLQLREEIEALEFSLRIYRAAERPEAATVIAANLASARREKEVIDTRLRQLAGLN